MKPKTIRCAGRVWKNNGQSDVWHEFVPSLTAWKLAEGLWQAGPSNNPRAVRWPIRNTMRKAMRAAVYQRAAVRASRKKSGGTK